jgi:sugar-specific transcriptional regulator TrmB
MESVELLQQLGMTQYEARAFIALAQWGVSTAYQVSKHSGIPRARIYEILEGLVNQGLAMIGEDRGNAKTYRALPVEVCMDRWRHRSAAQLDQVQTALQRIERSQPTLPTTLSTLRGPDNILAFCRILLQRAQRYAMLSIWDAMYDALHDDLLKVLHRDARVKGIVFGVSHPLGELHPHRMNPYMASIEDDRWFILSVDGQELFYGHSLEQDGPAYYTNDRVHLYLMEDYIWHDVLVNKLVAMGDNVEMDRWILPEMARFFERR